MDLTTREKILVYNILERLMSNVEYDEDIGLYCSQEDLLFSFDKDDGKRVDRVLTKILENL